MFSNEQLDTNIGGAGDLELGITPMVPISHHTSLTTQNASPMRCPPPNGI
jgi:hypothetical protein